MIKQRTIEMLEKEIYRIRTYDKNAKFDGYVSIKETPKCPKCGIYEGDGYN